MKKLLSLKHRQLFLGILMLVLCSRNVSLAQDDKLWRPVEVRILTEKEPPAGYIQTEEGSIMSNLKRPITTLDDLTINESVEMKKMAASFGAKIVYVDIYDLYKFKLKPNGTKPNQLYYFWVHEYEMR